MFIYRYIVYIKNGGGGYDIYISIARPFLVSVLSIISNINSYYFIAKIIISQFEIFMKFLFLFYANAYSQLQSKDDGIVSASL